MGLDRELLLDLLLDSLARPTPMTDQLEDDPALREFNETFVGPRLVELGASINFDELGSCVGHLPGVGDPILLVTFVMTHPAGGMSDPFAPRVVDDGAGPAVRGRAAAEQRGPMCAALAAVSAVADGPHRPVIFASLTSGESGRHRAAAAALADLAVAPAYGIVAICTDNAVVMGHKGRVDVRLHARGRAAHSSTPDLGANAAEAMVEYLGRALANRRPREHPDLGPATMALTRFVSGTGGAHTVPSAAEALLDVRLLPGEGPEVALELLPEPGQRGMPKIEVELGDSMLPAALSESAPPLVALRAAHQSELGRPAAMKWMSGSTDMGYLNHIGIPSACFGPGDEKLAHTDDERVSVEQAVQAARVYARLLTS
jgi:succinyl-diaminopimelate desuccinylase